MSKKPTYFYDEDVDVLYISFSPGEKATGAVGLHDNILLRFNYAEKRAIGLTLMDFSVLVQRANLGPRSFPLTGLQDLEEDWQETVVEIISKPPVNQILKMSVYTPSLSETMPIALVEKPPYQLAAWVVAYKKLDQVRLFKVFHHSIHHSRKLISAEQ